MSKVTGFSRHGVKLTIFNQIGMTYLGSNLYLLPSTHQPLLYKVGLGLRLWCLMPRSTICLLYRCGQFIGGGNQSTQRKPPTCRKSLTNFSTKSCIKYTSPWAEFKLTTLVVIGTDCAVSYKSNYHTITTPTKLVIILLIYHL
jgi:hypothetical protein